MMLAKLIAGCPSVAGLGILSAAVLMAVLGGCASAKSAGAGAAQTNRSAGGSWAIVIHGGAGMLDKSMSEDVKAAYRAGLADARAAGQRILAGGGTSLDAAEAAVRSLEDNELFNAGRGAVLTRAGTCELDASIMDGRTLKAGAATGLRTVKNPISFVRLVMERTPHIFFACDGAEKLADQFGVERVDPGYFITPRRREQLEKKMRELGLAQAGPGEGQTFAAAENTSSASQNPPPVPSLREGEKGTVGCVALDVHGNIAAATSTGGMTAKMPGRIGDSPIIGSGCYANNATLGVSCTGTGEQFMRHVAGHELAALVKYKGLSLHEAARVVLNERLDPDDGGLIAIDRRGNIVAMTTTGCMPRAWANSRGESGMGIWDPDR